MAYFLPEVKTKVKTSPRCADLVLDGVILEMKTTGGTRATIGGEFRLAYKQGATLAGEGSNRQEHSVFLRLLSDLEVDSIRAKIAGELKGRTGKGCFTCYFEHPGKLYSWTYDELRSIIGRKCPVPHRQNRVADEATTPPHQVAVPPAWDGHPLVADLRRHLYTTTIHR